MVIAWTLGLRRTDPADFTTPAAPEAPERMSRAHHIRRVRTLLVAGWFGILAGAAGLVRADVPSELEVTGMRFVRALGPGDELVVRAERARLLPDSDLAILEGVDAVVSDSMKARRHEIRCDRAELNLKTSDIRAEGRVQGVTSAGHRYSAPWVEYDHESGTLSSDAPVELVDDSGTYRGDGFRLHLREGRFQLLGNVRVVQTP